MSPRFMRTSLAAHYMFASFISPACSQKKCISKGIRTLPTGIKTRPPNKSSYKYDSCLEEYPQPYLIKANMKEYSLINESLVSTILS